MDTGISAREQYERGRGLLKREVLVFVTAREWPAGVSRPDIDSGVVVPWLEASPGFAFVLSTELTLAWSRTIVRIAERPVATAGAPLATAGAGIVGVL